MSLAGRTPATVNGFAARRALAALQKRNLDAAPLLRRAGLSDFNPDDPRTADFGAELGAAGRVCGGSCRGRPSDFTWRNRQTREKRAFSSMPFRPAKTFVSLSRFSPVIYYRLLPHGRANVEKAARALGVSPRTLARRLAEEGTKFAQLLDDLRRTLAFQYVREPNFSMAQIAWLLGYERSEFFTHAFRRWAGQTPSQVRFGAHAQSRGARMQNFGA